jgi:eukaryotic-like serine/threonine-protein kinase
MASEPPPPKGTRRARLGRYEVVAHIATGGMGAVYRARDTESDREVALKVLNPRRADDPAMLERFRREARHAAKLRHENIVTLYDADEVNGHLFLVMEFVDGIDLHEYVKRLGALDPEEARQLVLQGARALAHAYDRRIVHRDVKPSNFLITRKEGRSVVKLTDLGLAREVNADEFRVTRAGTTVGTLDYMAPEQARDSGSADIRSDLYSLGATWYHLLTGQALFPEGGLAERLYKIMNEPPPDPRKLNPRVSESTWDVLSRLLEKDPDDRYQTPAELIDDLEELEGQAASRPRRRNLPGRDEPERVAPPGKGPRLAPHAAGREDEEPPPPAPPPRKPARRPRRRRTRKPLLIGLGACAALLVVVGVVLAVSLRHRPPRPDTQAEVTPPPREQPPEDPPSEGPVLKTPPTPVDPRPPDTPAAKPTWPRLYRPGAPLDAAALRREVEAPWAKAKKPAGEPFVARVRRGSPAGGPTYPSLAAACAAAPSGRPVVVEVHDNGPLFERPVELAGRGLTVRAGKGYRPLLVWDVRWTLDERKRLRLRRDDRPAPSGPLVFLGVRRGALTLEGLDVALRWPESAAEPAVLLDVQGGDLTARDCTFSVAGKHPAPGRPPPGGEDLAEACTLARMRAEGASAGRCRLERCHARGASLVALELDAPGAEVLLDGCLLAGGEPPLLRVRAEEKKATNVRVVKSTLVCGQTLLEVRPARAVDHHPALRWLGWDALLSRSSPRSGGEMVGVRGGAETDAMKWQAVNCLYAGWQTLLAADRTIGGDDLSGWQRHWGRIEGDGVARRPWPERAFTEPAEVPASAYRPGKGVGFASSTSAEVPLGCELSALPAGRDNWVRGVFEPSVSPPESITDDSPPEIPEADGRHYQGERLDLTAVEDLGAYLAQVQRRWKLGPRVVLRLAGKGERMTSPIRVKGSTLVLYFEPPERGEERLALKGGKGPRADALVEVEGGNLEVINGEFHAPGAPYALKVRGGDLRMFRCRLEGPQQAVPAEYRGLVCLEGPGEKPRGCAVTECVLVSGRAGVVLQGPGARLLLRQSLVVAGTEALQLLPGPGFKGRPDVQCLLEQVTFAAREAVVRLGDVPAGAVREPAVVQARDCAYLNPFLGKPKAGLLRFEGDALPRGLLLWQGEREAFDRRLYFSAAPAGAPLPDKSEGHGPWAQLWGTPGARDPRPDLVLYRTFDARRWPLERLLGLPAGRGADLRLLGIGAKRSGRPPR